MFVFVLLLKWPFPLSRCLPKSFCRIHSYIYQRPKKDEFSIVGVFICKLLVKLFCLFGNHRLWHEAGEAELHASGRGLLEMHRLQDWIRTAICQKIWPNVLKKTICQHIGLSIYFFRKGHQGFFIVHSKVVLFMFRKGFLKIFVCTYLSFWC